MRNPIAAAVVSVALISALTYPTFSWSASGTSVQDIIDALKPHPGLSRGSRPVVAPPSADSPGPAKMASAPAAHLATDDDDRPSLDFNITFATGSAELTPESIRILDSLGKALVSTDLATFKFRIEGHTDTVGTADYNLELSERRANAVVIYLSRTYGIARARLEAVGMGQEALLIPTGPGVPDERNRRVHVINLSG